MASNDRAFDGCDVDGAIELREAARAALERCVSRRARSEASPTGGNEDGGSPDDPLARELRRAERVLADAETRVLLAVRARLLAAVRYAGVRRDAEDVVHDKLARRSSLTGAPSARSLEAELERCPRGRANALVWTIGLHAARDFLRRASREQPLADGMEGAAGLDGAGTWDEQPETGAAGLDGVLARAAREADLRRKEAALDALSPADREALLDAYLREIPDETLVERELGGAPRDAKEAGCVRDRIHKRRSRARVRAREAFARQSATE